MSLCNFAARPTPKTSAHLAVGSIMNNYRPSPVCNQDHTSTRPSKGVHPHANTHSHATIAAHRLWLATIHHTSERGTCVGVGLETYRPLRPNPRRQPRSVYDTPQRVRFPLFRYLLLRKPEADTFQVRWPEANSGGRCLQRVRRAVPKPWYRSLCESRRGSVWESDGQGNFPPCHLDAQSALLSPNPSCRDELPRSKTSMSAMRLPGGPLQRCLNLGLARVITVQLMQRADPKGHAQEHWQGVRP